MVTPARATVLKMLQQLVAGMQIPAPPLLLLLALCQSSPRWEIHLPKALAINLVLKHLPTPRLSSNSHNNNNLLLHRLPLFLLHNNLHQIPNLSLTPLVLVVLVVLALVLVNHLLPIHLPHPNRVTPALIITLRVMLLVRMLVPHRNPVHLLRRQIRPMLDLM